MRKIDFILACTSLLALLSTPAPAQAPPPSPLPNLVTVSARIATSGQPSAPALANLTALGYQAVIDLMPPNSPGAVRDEAAILERQGILYINIPVDIENPTHNDFETFVGAMAAMGTRKVLVHCQSNMRASGFVFLYRAIILKDPPDPAYEAVTRVWAPPAKWKQYMQGLLRTHGIGFDPK